MRAGFGVSAAVALVGACSIGGCALVYGYSGYGPASTSSGPGGAGSGGGGASSVTSSSGGTGGGGTAGGGGSGCGSTATGEPYTVAWSTPYGNDKPVKLAGLHLGQSGTVTLAANVTGEIDIGAKHALGNGQQGMLVAQFNGKNKGAPYFAKQFTGTNVTATALAVDTNDDLTAVASFSGSMAVDGPDWMTLANSTDSALVLLAAQTGSMTTGTSHQLHCALVTGLTSCLVTVASAGYFNSKLYLAGSFSGDATFDSTGTLHVISTDTDGYAAVYDGAAYQLAGTGNGEVATAYVRTSDGESVIGASISDAATLERPPQPDVGVCAQDAPTMTDIYVEKIKSNKTSDWACPTTLPMVNGDQLLDAIVPTTTDQGGIFMAGRTDNDFNYRGMGFMGMPGVFIARVQHDSTVTWVKSFQITTTDPVHLEVSPTDSNIILSGTFTGQLPIGGGNMVTSNGTNGFVAIFDGDGNQGWTSALVPCDGGDTTIIASWYDESSIAVAGTLTGPAIFAGKEIMGPQKPGFFVAQLDKNK